MLSSPVPVLWSGPPRQSSPLYASPASATWHPALLAEDVRPAGFPMGNGVIERAVTITPCRYIYWWEMHWRWFDTPAIVAVRTRSCPTTIGLLAGFLWSRPWYSLRTGISGLLFIAFGDTLSGGEQRGSRVQAARPLASFPRQRTLDIAIARTVGSSRPLCHILSLCLSDKSTAYLVRARLADACPIPAGKLITIPLKQRTGHAAIDPDSRRVCV